MQPADEAQIDLALTDRANRNGAGVFTIEQRSELQTRARGGFPTIESQYPIKIGHAFFDAGYSSQGIPFIQNEFCARLLMPESLQKFRPQPDTFDDKHEIVGNTLCSAQDSPFMQFDEVERLDVCATQCRCQYAATEDYR
jgi:hypothetical protein